MALVKLISKKMPTIKQILNTTFKAAIRGFDFDEEDGHLFTACYKTGAINVYQMRTPIQAVSHR